MLPEEMKFFNQMIDTSLLERLEKVRTSEFKRMPYTEAVEHLKKADMTFEYPVEWGTDLQSERRTIFMRESRRRTCFF